MVRQLNENRTIIIQRQDISGQIIFSIRANGTVFDPTADNPFDKDGGPVNCSIVYKSADQLATVDADVEIALKINGGVK